MSLQSTGSSDNSSNSSNSDGGGYSGDYLIGNGLSDSGYCDYGSC